MSDKKEELSAATQNNPRQRVFKKKRFRFLAPIWFPKRADNEVKRNRLFHFVVRHFLEPNKYPFFGTDICFLGTLFPISELLEWPARGQQNNLNQLAVFSLSTPCFRDDLKLS